MKPLFLISLLATGLLLINCKTKEDTNLGKLTLVFENKVGTDALVLNTKTYQNPLGQNFTVSAFRYYISNIKLFNQNTGAAFAVPDTYFLISNADRVLTLEKIPAGDYTQIQFSVGVDSQRNKSIDAVGDLDPSNEMAWDWNSGYKFVLMEGNYTTASKSGGLVFHIGEDANYKTLTFNIPPQAPNVMANFVSVAVGRNPDITFITDLNGLFGSPNAIDFEKNNVVMGGTPATKVAENYASGMFSIKSVNP